MFNISSSTAFLLGLVVAIAAGIAYQTDDVHHLLNRHSHPHAETEVHYHADLAVFIDGEPLDLSDDRYMSGVDQVLAESVHLHDNNDDVIHFHAAGISLGEFFSSIGITITDECLTLDTGESYCNDETKTLTVLANGAPVSDVANFVPNDEDQLLVYYGDEDTDLAEYTSAITADACIYSLTCPEKGTPPPESCGLTCEI